MSHLLSHLEPNILWNNFFQITQTPRPSKKEQQIQSFLIEKAMKHHWEYKKDSAGNIYIYVPASKGMESRDTVLIQNHIDMVCDKLPEVNHNFETDPIPLKIENGWIKTLGTTLGADNGIGVAFALSIAQDPEMIHPSLELLFTTDEETGLNGAKNFNPKFLSASKMINIDTEEWGSIYVGCAGGEDFTFSKQYQSQLDQQTDLQTEPRPEPLLERLNKVEIKIDGLKGGHSGIDIHLGRLSAIKVLATLLSKYYHSLSLSLSLSLPSHLPLSENKNLILSEFQGGKAHNIIPRLASATIYTDDLKHLKEFFEKEMTQIKLFCNKEDQLIQVHFKELNEQDSSSKKIQSLLYDSNLENFLSIINIAPDGVQKIDWNFKEELVSRSSNLAIVQLKNGMLNGEISCRFNNEAEREILKQSILAFKALTQINLVINGYYPSWAPITAGNQLLIQAEEIFNKNFSKSIQIKAIHAGLECGLIKEKIDQYRINEKEANQAVKPNLQIISIGPTITGAHSPSESLEIDSTQKLWTFFLNLFSCL